MDAKSVENLCGMVKMKAYSVDFYSKIIVTKCIDKNKTDEENIQNVENYLKNIIYKEIIGYVTDMRRASVKCESELLEDLGKAYYNE